MKDNINIIEIKHCAQMISVRTGAVNCIIYFLDRRVANFTIQSEGMRVKKPLLTRCWKNRNFAASPGTTRKFFLLMPRTIALAACWGVNKPARFFTTRASGGRVLASSSTKGVLTSGGQTSVTRILKRFSSLRRHSESPTIAYFDVQYKE